MVKIKSTEPSLTAEQELELLRSRVNELETERELTRNSSDRYLKEIQDLKKSVTAGNSNISIKAIGDKHISLWHVSGHNIGKRIGPIHPSAAEDTFIMFANAGIKISLNKPTEDFIENYKKTKEYKEFALKEETRREGKNRSKKASQIEKLTEAIAKQHGVNVKEFAIKERHEVGV